VTASPSRSVALHSAVPAIVDRNILDEESFGRAISLERKRTERSHRPFLLMLLDMRAVLREDTKRKLLSKIISALASSIRETDVTGWHKDPGVLGILFTELSHENLKAVVTMMLMRVRGLLYNTLSFAEFNQISLFHYIFPEQWEQDVPQRPSDPTLYPDLERREKKGKLYSGMKRVLDVVGSALGLVVFAPVFAGIAIAIKLTSKGPVLFHQQRVGQFGTPFDFLKFRSMYLDNDCKIHREYVQQLISGKLKPQGANGDARRVYKLTKDPRVTTVGSFLRRTSLDELPQLYNVLRGEMSLVGPRPAIPYEVEAYELWHRRRVLEAKPGITGLWQVNGRSRVGFDEMVRMDVRYALRRSLWLDLKILLRTPRAVLMGEGAY
jgi:lipopolysaccharide/colanic/teichoic acid biosynthesis glycosyltransferase